MTEKLKATHKNLSTRQTPQRLIMLQRDCPTLTDTYAAHVDFGFVEGLTAVYGSKDRDMANFFRCPFKLMRHSVFDKIRTVNIAHRDTVC